MEPHVVSEGGSDPEQVRWLDRKSPTLLDRLVELREAGLRISEDLNLNAVLQKVADEARTLADARYGAVLIFDEAGQVRDLAISGLTPEEIERIGSWPTASGLLGHIRDVQRPLRLAEVAEHEKASGFPDHHPRMRSLLGTSIRHRGEPIGNIYLTNKVGGTEFSPEDEETLAMFASQAALAITNALRYQEEQRARASLQALVDISPVGVVIFDGKTGDLLAGNPETLRIVHGHRLSGLSLSEIHETFTLRRLDGSQVRLEELPVERALRHGETVRAEEAVIHLPDGQAVTVIISAVPIFSEAGEVETVVATLQDLTPLEELERQRAAFLGLVNQELRTPLMSIKGSAATALDSSLPLSPVETHRFFRIIDEQADLMSDLIATLLDVTRIEAGMLSVAPEPTGVADVVDQAREAFRLAGGRNRIDVALPPDLPEMAADQPRIVQVLNNLFAYAARNSPESSPITVTASHEDSHILMAVVDEGWGLLPERLRHLFDKSSRTYGDGTALLSEASGLGLAICKGIVEAHGGRIWAESEGPGLGSRFTFAIPAAPEVPSVSADGSNRLPGHTGNPLAERACILALGDDPQQRRNVSRTLAEAGYDMVVTGDLREAERLIGAERPHLVLVDLALPETDGLALLRRIRGSTDAPVIFLSARTEDHALARLLSAGAADYVLKPFSPVELMARTQAALRKREAADDAQPTRSYSLQDLKIDYAQRSVTVAGRPVQLTETEYNLLVELSANAGRVLTHDYLLQQVWGLDYSGNPRLLQAFIKTLRRKIGDNARHPRYIFTEFRVGYRMPNELG